MAQKRMFSLSVIDTDSFIEMPISSRLLYYELGMRADDDGFVGNWKKILLFNGLKEDDLKVLIAKKFVIPFESGVIVIRHWRLNNYLQRDRTKPTIYQEEYNMLELDKEEGVYNLYTDCKHRLDKISIDKNSIEENSIEYISCKIEDNFSQEFDTLWSKFPNKKGKDNAKKDFIKARKSGTTYEEVEEGLNNYITYVKVNKKEPRYILNGSTWFHQHRWTDNYTNKDLNTSGLISQSEEFQEMLQKGLID